MTRFSREADDAPDLVRMDDDGGTQIRVAFTAAMMKLKGAKIPPQIVFPIQLQNQRVRDSCVKGYPQEASATSLIPLSLLKRMYP